MAFREITAWKFSLPLYIGDTIHVEIEVQHARPMARLGGGLVEMELDVKNQRGESVMRGGWRVLVQGQPADA
jgi:acyl dehydratase